VIPNDGDCFKCGKPGHWVDHCELNVPAADRKEHEARIALFVERWIDGKITAHQKQRLIEQENAMWNSAKTGAKAK
jgi:hypothetical protein